MKPLTLIALASAAVAGYLVFKKPKPIALGSRVRVNVAALDPILQAAFQRNNTDCGTITDFPHTGLPGDGATVSVDGPGGRSLVSPVPQQAILGPC